MKERHTALLEYIAEHGKTEVSLLADILGTSQVTIRKDLEYLSEKGMLKRERGYALPNDAGDIHYRIAFHIAQKAEDCTARSRLYSGRRNANDRIRLHLCPVRRTAG